MKIKGNLSMILTGCLVVVSKMEMTACLVRTQGEEGHDQQDDDAAELEVEHEVDEFDEVADGAVCFLARFGVFLELGNDEFAGVFLLLADLLQQDFDVARLGVGRGGFVGFAGGGVRIVHGV